MICYSRKKQKGEMEMQRLLIADGSELFACALQDALGSAFEIQICTDGCDTLALLEEYQPDVLVLDTASPSSVRPPTVPLSSWALPITSPLISAKWLQR